MALICIADSRTGRFLRHLLWNQELNLFFCLDWPFFIGTLKLVHFDFCIIIYSFVWQYPLCHYWYYYNQKYSATRKHLCWSLVFNEVFSNYSVQLRHKYFCEFSQTTGLWNFRTPFLQTPLNNCFCILTHSVYCATAVFLLDKNDVALVFRLVLSRPNL